MKNKLVIMWAGILAAIIFWAALPLFGKNYIPTHDGEYHIIRIVEFAKELGMGAYSCPGGPRI